MRPFVFATLLTSLIAMNANYAQGAVQTPAAGSAERKALLDTVRPPLEKRLHQPVMFVVDHLRVAGDWAFLEAQMQSAGGKSLSYAGTEFEEAAKAGVKSDIYAALLQRNGTQWTVKAEAIGPTDVAWANWSQAYGAPESVFGE
jgi:hypothetical protein